MARRTVCLKGHPLTPENMLRNGNYRNKPKHCCRICARIRNRASLKKHAVKIAANARVRRASPAGKNYQRNRDYRKHYGITLAQYEDMLDQQRGVCAISGQAPTNRRLHVDHNHKTNVIRQLLHQDINTAIGLFQENPDWLRAAADYIEKWKALEE
jgi:Recombination endonuclease VII